MKMKHYPNEAIAIFAVPIIARLKALRFSRDFNAPMPMPNFGSYTRVRAVEVLVVPFTMLHGIEVAAADDAISKSRRETMAVRAGGVDVENVSFVVRLNGCRPPRPVPVRLWPEAEHDDQLALSANAFSAGMEETE